MNINIHDAIDILRDAAGETPDRYFVVGDGTWYWTREEAEQRLRTLFTNQHDRLAQQAQARAAHGVHA